MKILVINPNTNAETTERIRLASVRAASDDTYIDAVTAPFGVQIIKTLKQAATAADAMLSVLADRETIADAVVIAAFSDPGLRQAKAIYPTPVVGIAEAAMLEAATISDRFSIVTMGPPMVSYLPERAVDYGVEGKLAKVRILPWSTRAGRPADIDKLTAECIAAIQDDGAGAVIIGGGPLAGLAETISHTIRYPVLDGVACAIRLAERLVNKHPVEKTSQILNP